MFDLRKFLEDVGRTIGSFTGANNQPATSRQQQAPQAQPATTRQPQQRQQQNLGQALQQQREQYKLPQVDFGKFANDTFSAISNVAKPISEGGANPFADAGKFAEEKIVKPLAETAVKAGNTVALPVEAGIAAATGANKRPEVQQQLYKRLQGSFISPEAAGGRANPVQFAKEFTGAGVDTSGLLPITRGVKIVELGAKPSLEMLKQSVLTSAKQAGILGTASTANDVIQGRGVTAQSLAANYLAPAALGVGSDALGSLVRPAARVAATAPSRVTNYGLARPTNLTTPEINAALRVRQAREGYISPQEISPNEIALYDAAQTKLGARPGTPEGDMAVINALASERNFNTQRDVRRQATADTLQRGSEFVRSRLIPGGTLDAPLGSGAPKGQSRFAAGAARSNEISPELQAQVRPSEYSRVANADQMARSDELLKQGADNAYTSVNERLSRKNVDDQTVSDSIALIKKLDEAGDEGSLQKATDIIEKVSEQLTKSGQAVQAASLLSNRTPQGLFYGAVRSLKKAGVEVDQQIQSELKSLVDVAKKSDASTSEGALARYNIAKYVNDRIPSSTGDKLVNLWRAGLLTAPTTTGGNILGNTGETLVRKAFVNPVSAGADALMGAVTGKRTKTLGGGFAGGASEGAGKLKGYLQTGFDERNALSKYDTRELNYGDGPAGKALTRYTNGVYRLMSVADQPFWYGARREALQSIAKAEAINSKVPRANRREFIEDFVANPPTKALERATQDAMYATFQNKTGLGKAALGFKNGLNDVAPGLGDFIVPFTQVPAAIATRIIQRTPAGTAVEVVKQIKRVREGGKFDQRAMAEAIGEGAFGTAVLASGYALANSGLLTFGFPEDQKERELWEAEGKQPYSIKIGDRWYSLNYIQPFGTLLAIGGQASTDVANGTNPTTAIGNALGTAGQSIMNQSFLKGVSGVLEAIDDPARYGENFIENTAGSVIPNFVRSFARSADPMQRDPSGLVQGVQAGIPGLREQLPEKQDMFGQGLPSKDNFANQYLNPLRPSVDKAGDPVTEELRRLYEGDEGVLPTRAKKDAFGEIELSKEQVNEIDRITGPEIKKGYESTISDPRYKDLSDEDKRKALKKVNDTVFGSLKSKYGVEQGFITADKADLNTDQKRYLKGQGIDALTSEKTKTYAEKYDDAVKDFESKKNELSRVEKVKREKEIAKLSVQKDFDNDTVDAYGLSKTDAWNLLSTDQDGKKLFDQIVQYGDALVNAGIEKQNKYRDKYGNIVLKDENAETAKKGKGKGKGKKGKFDYASQFATTDKLGNASTDAIRKLVRGTKITRKKIGGKA